MNYSVFTSVAQNFQLPLDTKDKHLTEKKFIHITTHNTDA